MSDPTTLTPTFLSQEPGAAAGESQRLACVKVVDLLAQHEFVDLPVVDLAGRLLGLIHQRTLIQGIPEDATVDTRTMAGTRKPVIAGQSGHAGGQALTVTRRSLAGAPGIAMPLAGLI